MKKLSETMIYAICEKETRTIVYVGKTTNIKNRIQCYLYPNSCKNVELREWLKMKEWVLETLEVNPSDLSLAEISWIKTCKGNLFNLDHGGDQNWREHNRLPWMASKGIKCPSDIIINRLRTRNKESFEEFRNYRRTLSVFDRCLFEVSLAREHYPVCGPLIDKWLYYTKDRLINCLEKNGI